MWVLYDKKVAGFINFILTIFLIAFIKNGYDIYDTLAVDDKDAVTGVFQNFEQYEGLGDLANKDQSVHGSDGNSDAASRASRPNNRGTLLNVQLGQGTQGHQGTQDNFYGEADYKRHNGTDSSNNAQFQFSNEPRQNVYDDQQNIQIRDENEERKDDGVYNQGNALVNTFF